MVHTGACIASLLGQGGSHKYHLTCTWLRYFKNDRDRRDMITCGAAAGVAAAFRAPVGGVLFALEEAASWYLFQLKLLFLSQLHGIFRLQTCNSDKKNPYNLYSNMQYKMLKEKKQ